MSSQPVSKRFVVSVSLATRRRYCVWNGGLAVVSVPLAVNEKGRPLQISNDGALRYARPARRLATAAPTAACALFQRP